MLCHIDHIQTVSLLNANVYVQLERKKKQTSCYKYRTYVSPRFVRPLFCSVLWGSVFRWSHTLLVNEDKREVTWYSFPGYIPVKIFINFCKKSRSRSYAVAILLPSVDQMIKARVRITVLYFKVIHWLTYREQWSTGRNGNRSPVVERSLSGSGSDPTKDTADFIT